MAASFQLLTSRTFVNQLLELGEVYAQAFSGPPYHKPDDELASFVEDGLEQSGRPGFVACAAFEQRQAGAAARPVGFAYASELLPEYWWYRQIEPHLVRIGQTHWLQDAFELTQMAVLPGFQGQGIGGRLHDLLLTDLPNRHGLLSTLYGETNATGLYRRRGWQILLEPFQFSGVNRSYRIMGKNIQKSKPVV